jgi:trigger factor
VPLPDSLVASEVEMRGQSLDEQLERAGATRDTYLEASGQTAEQLAADMENTAKRSVKAGFVLDKLAAQENLGVEQAELNNFVIEQAYRMGVQPDRLAQELADHGQIGSVVGEVLRAKALSLIAERAAVTDEAGRPVDLQALAQEQAQQDEDDAEDALDAAAEVALVAEEEAEVAEDEAEAAIEAEEAVVEAEIEAEAEAADQQSS